MKYLVESCLLAHGLESVTDREMEKIWQGDESNVAWVEKGEIKTGPMDAFLYFRRKGIFLRGNEKNLDRMLEEGADCALTASGTMEVCRRWGIPRAVSCGIGGISNIEGVRFSTDMNALAEIPVNLIAAAPKDMLDLNATLRWLREHGVSACGYKTQECTGYLFCREPVKLLPAQEEKNRILLVPVPEEQRLQDTDILDQAIATGLEAMKAGKAFHPAVNAALDRLSGGYSSKIQLEAILRNAKVASDSL